MDKKVSIVVPVYNVERYLRQCLDSIANQTYENFEAILIDDGATDSSGCICDEYAERDSRFRVIHQENAGAANAKNTGLDAACGAYVAFVDSDDWVERHWLESMVSVMKSSEADVVECDFLKEYLSSTERGNDASYCPGQFSAHDYLTRYLNNWTCSLFWNKLVKVNLLSNIRFRRERRCIDDEFFTYKVLTNAKKIVRIEDCLYHYRQRASSAVSSPTNSKQITDDALEILKERYMWITYHFPDLRKTYIRHDVNILFYFARSFAFCEETRLKFRKNARFYLIESIRSMVGLQTICDAMQLCIKECWKLMDQRTEQYVEDISKFYQ